MGEMCRHLLHITSWVCGALLLASLAVSTPAVGQAVSPSSTAPAVDLERVPERTRQRIEALGRRIDELTAAAADPAEVARAFGALGRAYLAYEYYDAATATFRRAAELDPSAAPWSYYLGMTAAATGDLAAAAARFRDALDRAPADLPTLVRLARVETERGELAAAGDLYRQALAIDPEVAAVHAGLGEVAALEGKPAVAVEHFERALELLPEATSLHYQLAQQYRRLGDEAAARRHLEQRGDQVPGFPDPLGRAVELERVETAFEVVRQLAEETHRLPVADVIGFAIAQFGDVEGAIEAFERHLESATATADASPARLLFVLGALYARQGDAERALDLYRQALAADPELTEVHTTMAWALRRLGRDDEALEHLGIALARDPDDPTALLRRADMLASRGELEGALADLDRLVRLEPESSEVHLRRGSLLAELGRIEESIAAFREGLARPMARADRALAERHLGSLLVRTGSSEEAIPHFRRAVELDPGYQRARIELATLLLRTGDVEGAAAVFQEARRTRPDDPNAYLGEATARLLLGDEAGAAGVLQAGREGVPGDRRIAASLARLLASASDPSLRDPERALAIARELVDADPSILHRETLAMALAAAGRFDEAVALQEELIASARAQGEEAIAQRMDRVLELYRNRLPCCGDGAVTR